MSAKRDDNTKAVRDKAKALGFDAIGFAPAGPADPDDRLRAWLDRGWSGTMDYMARTADERADPTRLVPGAKSVVALATSYYHPDGEPAGDAKVSRYANSTDYHKVIKKRLRKLRRFLLELDPEARVHPAVDTSPVLEREWAARAGVGWIGKSTMLIGMDLGTYTFLGTLITTMEFNFDVPHLDRCGSCTACLDACPTDAFAGPYELEATKCITYWNVEYRGPFPHEAPDLHGWMAGCDVCQEVCPWNKFKKMTQETKFTPRLELATPNVDTFLDAGEDASLALRGTPLQRTGVDSIRRNLLRILGRDDP